jgi:hypothetical protein
MQIAIRRANCLTSALFLAFLFLASARAQNILDYAVQLSAVVQKEPPQIVLTWPAAQGATGYIVSRKSPSDTTWGIPIVTLPAGTSAYLDPTVAAGQSYEYQVTKVANDYISHGYVLAGIERPLVESRGKLILIVDSTYTVSLAAELARLQQDLVGDGWFVLRHDTPRMAVDPASADPSLGAARSNEVFQVKRLIQTDYLADPTNVWALFLFGHVPVPYSGNFAPDGHLDHTGAWPADAFYGDMTGLWTDSSVTSTNAADPRNRNVPGDGKFDQQLIPGNVVLQIGRVDMANLPAFPLSELDLLRQYLNKDHNFRHGFIQAQPRGLIDDNLGFLDGQAPAINGWGNFAAFFGAGANLTAGRWLTVLPQADYLWGYGCGAGTYTSAFGVADSTDFIVYDTEVVFTMLFGSYFGDWDSQNNLLRSQLTTPTYTLTAAWSGRPNWFFHQMALGETIGLSTQISQNNSGLYLGNKSATGATNIQGDDLSNNRREVHIALMGDPTLRLQAVKPPGFLGLSPSSLGTVDLNWTPSPDSVLGYNVYRAPAAGGPYLRLNSSLISETHYSDSALTSDRFYMVRAVKLDGMASGTYFNASQGVFAELAETLIPLDSGTWPGGSSANWTMNDAAGTAGGNDGWAWVTVNGPLVINASASDEFNLRVSTLATNGFPGPPANFDNNHSYSWPLITTEAGILGFDPSELNLLTDEFQGDLGGGLFSLALSGDAKTINLLFTPNHAPIARPAVFNPPLDTPVRVDISDFLASYTTDPDGDARALIELGASTNGTSIVVENSALIFTSTNNFFETIPYWVQDIRPYRAGDTPRTASSYITIAPIPTLLPFNAYHAIELEWQGDPGKRYQIQSRAPDDFQWTNEGDPILGTGQNESLFQRASNSTRFYRIIAVD